MLNEKRTRFIIERLRAIATTEKDRDVAAEFIRRAAELEAGDDRQMARTSRKPPVERER